MKSFFSNLDPESIFRHILWSAVFIIVCAYISIDVIVPAITKYKGQAFMNDSAKASLAQVSQTEKELRAKIDSIKKENKQSLVDFHRDVQASDISRALSPFFVNLNVTQVGFKIDKKNNIKETTYELKGLSPNISYITDVAINLRKSHIFANISFPVSIKSRGKMLAFTYTIVVFQGVFDFKSLKTEPVILKLGKL
ncbi:hypothetical protein BKH43_07765 [Helicobacter sp. 13S00401-1]|uniref:hypothetical protein n=1 Tax=Helicobacter sp. 13S00401-1 TaxID=1905758 RepID=UPI000BA5D8FF|nr:hypothetical protein [Helicobacter sp. 13S00401-1]PAF48791.1 hypothetical protein BKH43_07765 [Helicobacter sp. 13S00401-1]